MKKRATAKIIFKTLNEALEAKNNGDTDLLLKLRKKAIGYQWDILRQAEEAQKLGNNAIANELMSIIDKSKIITISTFPKNIQNELKEVIEICEASRNS